MPFVSRRAQLRLGKDEIEMLTALLQSRSQPAGRVLRASMLWRYHAGNTISEIARVLGANRPRVERCVSKALDLGLARALVDLPGRGRRRIELYLKEVNETPVVFRWKYKLDTLSLV